MNGSCLLGVPAASRLCDEGPPGAACSVNGTLFAADEPLALLPPPTSAVPFDPDATFEPPTCTAPFEP